MRFRRPLRCPACRVALAALWLLLSIGPTPAVAWDAGCGITVTYATAQPRVELAPSTPQIVAIARFSCATARVRTVQLCLLPTITDGACTTTTLTARRGVLTARCLLSPFVGDRWTVTATVDDPLLGTRQAEAVLIAELSAGCVTREGVAAMS